MTSLTIADLAQKLENLQLTLERIEEKTVKPEPSISPEITNTITWVLDNFTEKSDNTSGIVCSKFAKFVEVITGGQVNWRKVRPVMRELGHHPVRINNKEHYRGIRFSSDTDVVS